MVPMYAYEIGIAVVSIMLAVGGIVFGLGYSFDNKRLKDFGSREILESLINGAIIGVLIIAFAQNGIFTGIINSVAYPISGYSCGSAGYNYAICFAENYMMGLGVVKIQGSAYPSLFEVSSGMLLTISGTYAFVGLISSLQFSIGLASISLSSIFHPLLMQLNSIMQVLTLSIFSLYIQYTIIKVVSAVAVPIMLPVGIVLRTFYFTRRLGGAIMAISISLFAILPLTYVFDASIANSYSSSVASNLSSTMDSMLVNLTSTSTLKSVSYNSLLNLISSILKEAENSVISLFDELAMLVVQTVFFPILSVILTIISARELARVMGTEVSFSKFDVF